MPPGVQFADDLSALGVEVCPSAAIDQVLDTGGEQADYGERGEQDHDSPPDYDQGVRCSGALQRHEDGEGDRTQHRDDYAGGEVERLAFEPIPDVRGVVRAIDPGHLASVPCPGQVGLPR